MNYPFARSVNIMGTEYTIEVKTMDKDEGLKHNGGAVGGYLNYSAKKIVIKDKLSNLDDSDDERIRFVIQDGKKTLRHEIVHGFLIESGLGHNTKFAGNWADNEEMVDWIALQGPKIVNAWLLSGAIEPIKTEEQHG